MKERTKDFWIGHCEALKEFNGTQEDYCKLHGLKRSTLSTRKIALGYGNTKKRLVGKFAKVEVVESVIKDSISLPNPEWVAKFLKAWSKYA